MVWNHMILIFLKQANPSFEEHMTPPLPLQKKKKKWQHGSFYDFIV